MRPYAHGEVLLALRGLTPLHMITICFLLSFAHSTKVPFRILILDSDQQRVVHEALERKHGEVSLEHRNMPVVPTPFIDAN